MVLTYNLVKPKLHELIGKQKSREFADWAFHEDLDEIDCLQYLVKCWNEIHGDLLKIDCSGNWIEDLVKMIDLWEQYHAEE